MADEPPTIQDRGAQNLANSLDDQTVRRQQRAAAERGQREAEGQAARSEAAHKAANIKQPGPAERVSYAARFEQTTEQRLAAERQRQQQLNKDIADGRAKPPTETQAGQLQPKR